MFSGSPVCGPVRYAITGDYPYRGSSAIFELNHQFSYQIRSRQINIMTLLVDGKDDHVDR